MFRAARAEVPIVDARQVGTLPAEPSYERFDARRPALGWALLACGLWLAALGATIAASVPRWTGGTPGAVATGFTTTALAAAVSIGLVTTNGTRWHGARIWFGGVVVMLGYLLVVTVAAGSRAAVPGPQEYALGTALLVIVGLTGLVDELRGHARGDASEIASDVLLMSVVTGGWVYLLLSAGHGAQGSFAHATLTTALGCGGVVLFSGFTVLAMWWPSRVHLAYLCGTTMVSATAIAVAFSRQFERNGQVAPAAEVMMFAALLGLTAMLAARSVIGASAGASSHVGQRVRPWLLVLSLVGACVFLGSALVTRGGGRLDAESAMLVAAVAGLVGLRTVGNQRAMALTNRRLQGAVREREDAADTLRTVVDELAGSEQRLRGLLDAAVDGVVELGAGGAIVRANDAFRSMVGLDTQEIVGSTWQDVADHAGSSDAFAALRGAGHASLIVAGRTVHLEARASVVPTEPPGTLLLVRDVTTNKVAEQTIRTLFQFLQDRDEDRTSYLRRTNLAIEAERNKIARDLHDGPIQGVAAASLSLEAVRLMVVSGQLERAGDMLGAIQGELREETENLRRLMSDLRPPLLDERGLVPALRELCTRFEESTGIVVDVRSSNDAIVPSEVETIAYRVVQEALSNARKHSGATGVSVRVLSSRGSLEVEIKDDGCGFDAASAREFLRRGKVGLASMRERTELGSGTFTVRSRPGGGTTVTATLPFDLLARPRE